MPKFVVFLSLLFTFAIGFLEETSAQSSKEKTLAPAIRTFNIVEAIKERKIEAETIGAGLAKVKLKLKRIAKEKFRVVIPPGTYFVNHGEAQNMVATEEVKFTFIKIAKPI